GDCGGHPANGGSIFGPRARPSRPVSDASLPMQRIFPGLEIPADIGEELAMLRGGLPGARWVDPENYHLTLRFIGDVDDRLAHEVASMLGMVRRTTFELRFDRLLSFGGRKPRAVVAAVAPTPALMELQAEHERLMQ